MTTAWLRARWAAFIVGPLVALVVIIAGCFIGRT